MKNKIVALTFLLFLFGCQKLPGNNSPVKFEEAPASTLMLSNEVFIKATGGWPLSVYWSSEDYLSVTGSATGDWSPVAVKLPELSIISRPSDSCSGHSKISPDGKYFLSFLSSGASGISSMADLLEAGRITPIHSLPDDMMYGMEEYQWSRDSQNLAMLSVNYSEKNSITLYIYNLPTRTLKTIFEYVEQIQDTRIYLPVGDLSWSADGKRFAFSVAYETNADKDNHKTQIDLFVYNIEQNKLVKVTSTPDVNEFYPSWYPENDILMFVTSFVTSKDVNGLVNGNLSFSTNDGECIRVLPGYEGISYPSWSPDGKQIVYLSSTGIHFLEVGKIIPPEYLSPGTLCEMSDGSVP